MAKQKVSEPCVIIKKTFDEYQIPVNQAALELQLSPSAVRQLISGKTKITSQVGLRLAKYFNTTSDYWVNLQNQYDLAEAQKDPKLVDIVKSIPKAKKAPAPKKPEPQKAAPKGKAAAAKGKSAKADAKPVKSPKKPAPKAAKPKKAAK
jgi:addiction module HigA family antidote